MRVILWLVVNFLFTRVISEVIVTFTSSPDPPNIAEGGTANFNCSSNHSAVFINWLLNETVSASTLTSDGVTVNGASTPVSSLTIPGLVDPFNNTQVQCVAFGFGIGDFSPSSVILKVQGVLSEVVDLSCEEKNDDCIECNWEAPFSLTIIQHYIVNITNIKKTVTLRNSNTTARYCPEQYGQYNISVAANNSAGLGAVSFEIVELRPNTKWRNICISSSSTKQGYWNFTFTASTTSFLVGDYDIIVHFNDSISATGIAEVGHHEQVSGTISTGRLDKRKWNMSISIEYGTSNILISEPVEINTFGIYEWNVTVDGFKICVEAEFIDGSDTMECLVEYKSSDHSRGTISITRENPRGCTKDVSANNYTVILYAGRFNESDKIFAVLNAIVSIASITETSSVILPSSSSGLPSSTIPVDTNKTSFPTELIAVVTSVPIIIIVILIGIVITMIVLFSKKKNRIERANKGKHEHADKEAESTLSGSTTRVVYLDTEVSTDRPRAPPTMEEKVQLPTMEEKVLYTKVESQGDALYSLAIPITENYSVMIQNISENPNTSEYSHLNSRGYKSPHQPEIACNDTKEMYSTSIPLAHGNMNKEFSYAVFVKYVAPHISHKWEELGLALALTPDDIEQLKENHEGINDVFLFWERQKTRPFTWETLIMALMSINEHELANKINVMDYHNINCDMRHSSEVLEMTRRDDCNLSITQQNTSEVMKVDETDGRKRREEVLANQGLPEGESGRFFQEIIKDKLRVERGLVGKKPDPKS